MNEFESRINALRLYYKAERAQIQQDCDNLFTRLNKTIAATDDRDVHRILRAEKFRVYTDTRRAIRMSMRCYRQQLDTINEEYRAHLSQTPSNRAVRRAMTLLCRHADARGEKSFTVTFGDNHRGHVSFD